MLVFDPLNSDYPSQLFSAIGRKLYLNSELADVHFVFGPNDHYERVPVNKAHLMAASDVFATMFNGSWKEKDEVEIADTSAAAFKEFLQFFYFGQVKLTMENVGAVMNLGEMYNVAECLAVCSKFLKNNLNEENVCRHYRLAILFNQHKLKQSCETIIGFNTNSVFNSTDFLACDRTVLAEILELDWLSCTEVELFEACMSWVRASSKKDVLSKSLMRAHLGDLFHEIRFGSMSFQEFSSLIPSYGQLFNASEYGTIIQMIADDDFEGTSFNGNRVKRFDSDPWNEEDVIICNRLLMNYKSIKPYFLKNLETTKFSTNEPLLLKDFAMARISKHRNGKYNNCEDVPTEFTIIEVSGSGDSRKEVEKYNGKANLESATSTYVGILKPILIKPGFMYEIRLKQNPPENCSIGVRLKSMVQMMDGITIQFHDDPLVRGDISSTGLVYGIDFYRIE
ncbi:uncharacterized protein LOC129568119 [Sitodiplosis mosellana]|uniref:uncharacterized protein LOC129568119 n=1 Tax=Sitodiplosis mosellana TaxID=263140 RepID=UPI002443F10E|nr:uncharacterized protein LOC129568119 [Sitodiplosis mosellana]XP_055301661.1 uncharacterized protein LOC129568119 [Sitodiplosis mosellana]